MRAADPITEGPLLRVARPAVLKRDTTEAGHHPGLSRCRWLGMRRALVFAGPPGSVFEVVGTIFVPTSRPAWGRSGTGRTHVVAVAGFFVGDPHGQALALLAGGVLGAVGGFFGNPMVIAAGVTASCGGLVAALARRRRGGQERSRRSDKNRGFNL
jgi:hypothetical protein